MSGPATRSDPRAYDRAIARLRQPLVAVLAFSAVVNVAMLTGAIYMLQVYDRVLTSRSIPTLVGLFAIVVVLYAFLGLFDTLRRKILYRAALDVDLKASGAAYDVWLRAALPQASGASDAGATLLKDLATVRAGLAGPGIIALCDLPFVPIFVGFLFLVHPWIGLLTLAGAGIVVLVAVVNRFVSRGALSSQAKAERDETRFAEGTREAVETVVAMGMGRAISQRWQALHRRAMVAGQNGAEPSEALAALSRSVRMLLQSAILSLGALLVIWGEISAGMIIASSVLSGRALAPVDQIVGQWRGLAAARAAHGRVRDCFAGMPVPADHIDLPAPEGHLTVRNVSKQGSGRNGTVRAAILNSVDFQLRAGEALGIVGHSGSGKSTLARVLTGTWLPDSGEIRLDEAALDQWDPVRLGHAVGYLPQRTELLPGTIRDNIARMNPDAEDADVIEAARKADIHHLILRLPDGYATEVSSTHAPLSGGQMQRLGLARALFGQPCLVILDEPNASLDAVGERALERAIAQLRADGTTVVVVTHKPSLLKAVDKMLVMKDGAIEIFGPRKQVLKELKRKAEGPGRQASRIVARASAAAERAQAREGLGAKLTGAAAPVRRTDSAMTGAPVAAGPAANGGEVRGRRTENGADARADPNAA